MRNLARSAVRTSIVTRARPRYEPDDRRVWLIRPDHLGDLLFLRPALKRFRSALPDWHITLVVGPWSRAVVERDENVDEVLTIPFPGFTRSEDRSLWQPYRLLFDEAERLRDDRPAVVVVLRDDHWWGAMLARLAGTPRIIGSDHAAMHGLLTNQVCTHSRHWVARNVEMLDQAARLLGAKVDRHIPSPSSDPLCWNVTEQDRADVTQLLEAQGVVRPIAVIHLGSGAPVKLWPVDRWAGVADCLATDGLTVILSGSEAEQPYLAQIARVAQSKPVSLAGKTSIGTLAALFESATVVAGVDSGPLHLAAAVDTPTVHIYGPSDAATYGPWGDSAVHRVVSSGLACPRCGDLSLSRPEGAGCMVAVSSETMVTSIRELLAVHA